MLSNRIGIKELILLSLVPASAKAHHVMEGELPNSIVTGFISGVAHPVIGLDHLAFVIAIGLLSLGFSKRLLCH
jgi:urease accessory protein